MSPLDCGISNFTVETKLSNTPSTSSVKMEGNRFEFWLKLHMCPKQGALPAGPSRHARNHYTREKDAVGFPQTPHRVNLIDTAFVRSEPQESSEYKGIQTMMGRMTRKKAAEVAEQLHVDEDDVLQLPSDDIAAATAKTPEQGPRAPLGELAPNSAESKSHSEDGTQDLKKSVRGNREAKKAVGRSKKNDLGASTTSQPIDNPQDVLLDANDSAPSPASEKAAEELLKDVPELCVSISLPDTRPESPQSAAAMLTRSQLKERKVKLDPEPKSLVDGIGQTPEEQEETMKEESASYLPIDVSTSPPPSAMPKVISQLRADTPAKRSTSNKENIEPMASPLPTNYDVLEEAVIAATTPQQPAQQSPPRPEDHIVALDELDDAVENVSKDIPEVQTSPEKDKSSKEPDGSPVKKRKAAPEVRTTKASQARISLAQSSKDATNSVGPSLGRPRPSMALGRSSSVRHSSANHSGPSGRRVTSTSGSKDEKATDGEKKELVIPHSKPRPVSLSFPTPPPPAKSTKAPTQSNFKLPGEAVAERLKAAREARMQKVPEEEIKKPFKARPVPTTLSKAPSVRQTTASKARESIMTGKDLNASTATSGAGLKRANSVATSRPAPPRSRFEASKSSTASTKAVDALTVKKRASTAMANVSKPREPRASLATTAGPSNAPRLSSLPSKSSSKGKEVFNRPAAAKAAAEKEKLEKEAAAKKARADAAERSRQMSREWAEKQKKKQLAAKKGEPANPAAESTTVETTPATEVAVDA